MQKLQKKHSTLKQRGFLDQAASVGIYRCSAIYVLYSMYSVRDDFTVVFKRVAWLCTWALHLGSASPQDQEISVTLHLGVICLKIWCGIWVLKLLIYAQIFWHFPFIMHLSYCILIFSYHLLYFDNLRCVCFLKTNKIINYLGYYFL